MKKTAKWDESKFQEGNENPEMEQLIENRLSVSKSLSTYF